jgi:hypothetical protein
LNPKTGIKKRYTDFKGLNQLQPFWADVHHYTFGRSNFFEDGGKFSDADACIDLTNQMDDFVEIFGTWPGST